ncbi:hypothetical protein [Delftia tsuruhatensis]|uniref:hypothetical protein n=1 Tax=Delftia tsuruhatensis TaxID=180282 RepID=UPI001AEB8361
MTIRLIAFTLAVLMTGCSTVATTRGKAVAEVGKKYVETMGEVNDLAYEKTLTFSANLLGAQVAPRLMSELDAFTESHQARGKLIAEYKAYLAGLTEYFAGLEALAGGDQSEATSAAMGKVIDTLKAPPAKLKISDERKTALTGLTGMVAKGVHNAAVEKALIRDADIIAQALAVTDKMLDEHIRQIEFREKAAREKLYAENVVKPFGASIALNEEWKRAWITYVRISPAIAILQEGQKASTDMQRAWKDALRGNYSFSEIQATLASTKAKIEALAAVKDAT